MANSNFRLDFSRKDVFECCLCALRGAGLCLPSHKVHVLGGGLSCYCQSLFILLHHLLEFNLMLPEVAKEGFLLHWDGVCSRRKKLGWVLFSQKAAWPVQPLGGRGAHLVPFS